MRNPSFRITIVALTALLICTILLCASAQASPSRESLAKDYTAHRTQYVEQLFTLQGLYEVRFEAERIYINNVAKLTMKFVKDSLDNISLPGNRYVAALEIIKRLREKAGLVTDTSDDVKVQVKLIRFIKSLNEEISRRESEKSALLEKMKKDFDEILAIDQAAVTVQAPGLGKVTGTVYVYETTKGWNMYAQGATVTLKSPTGHFSAVTDKKGAFTITGVPPGDYTIRAEKTYPGRNYIPEEKPLKVTRGGGSITLTITWK
ncbi:MAG: carboxypeptidase-like regulatory domain-containing protein [Candidatus Xenobiia bacterium LiM19]